MKLQLMKLFLSVTVMVALTSSHLAVAKIGDSGLYEIASYNSEAPDKPYASIRALLLNAWQYPGFTSSFLGNFISMPAALALEPTGPFQLLDLGLVGAYQTPEGFRIVLTETAGRFSPRPNFLYTFTSDEGGV